MPRHKKKKRAAAPAASVKKTDWLVGDLVVAKLRGHRPWPAQIQKPEDYGYDARPHRIFVTFFGTEETCFCSYNKITPFTSAVRKNLAEQLQKINTNPELERAIKEIFAADDELKMPSKSLGSNQKEDDEMASEKSEEEEPPVERSRKRARVVEEAVAPVSVVDERPAKQEKTVKSMAAEQVQKLPRKVRIKVSSQGSDLPTPQQGMLPGSDKAGVSSSQAPQSEGPPLRTSVGSAKTPVKNGDRTTTGKVDDSVNLKESENVVVEEGETISRHASENGGEAAEKTQEDHATTGSATAKTKNDGVEKMEVDDEKSVASNTSEPAVGKEDDETSLATKTSETVTRKEDDSSTAKEPVASERADEGVEKMELDDEKFVASKTNTKPTIGDEDDDSTAKESVTSVTAEDGVEKMEVDEEKTKTSKPAIEEDESVKGDPAHKVVEASNVSTTKPQESESSVAAKGQDPQTVEDMETSRAGQEQVPPVAKGGVVDRSKSKDTQRESGAKVDREDGLEIKASSASAEPLAIDEAMCSANKDPVSASKEEDTGEQKHGAQEVQVSISATKEDAASRTDLQDGAVPEQSSKSTNQGETVPDTETQASRLNQAGAVDRTEDRDGAVEKVEHQDEAVKAVEDREGAVKEIEDQDRAAKKLEDQNTGVKKLEGQGAEVTKAEDHGAEVKKTEDKNVDMKTEDQDGEVKKTEHQDAEVKATEDNDAALKTILGKDSLVKKADGTPQIGSGESKVSTPALVKGDALPRTVTETTVDSTPVQPESIPQISTGNGEVSSTGKQESEVPQLGAADRVEVSTRAMQDAADEKQTNLSKELPSTAS